MYSIILCAAAALLIGVGGFFLDLWGWIGGPIMSTLVFAGSWILLTRLLGRRLEPQMATVRKQAELGQIDAARLGLTTMLPMGRWVPMLGGQIQAQLGMLALHGGDEDRAIAYLIKASRRAVEAQMMLACVYYRRKDSERALAVMTSAAPFQRKHCLFQNLHAYFLSKEDRLDDAIEVLNRVLRKVPEDGISQDNLLRLKNRQRMDLRVFGEEWFALGLERPPQSMGELRTVRKGFRQPKKQTRNQAAGGSSSKSSSKSGRKQSKKRRSR